LIRDAVFRCDIKNKCGHIKDEKEIAQIPGQEENEQIVQDHDDDESIKDPQEEVDHGGLLGESLAGEELHGYGEGILGFYPHVKGAGGAGGNVQVENEIFIFNVPLVEGKHLSLLLFLVAVVAGNVQGYVVEEGIVDYQQPFFFCLTPVNAEG